MFSFDYLGVDSSTSCSLANKTDLETDIAIGRTVPQTVDAFMEREMSSNSHRTIVRSTLGQISFKRIRFLVIALAPIVILTVAALVFRDKIEDFGKLGYVGVFGVNLIASAALIIPIPGLAFALAAGAVLNPLIVGAAGGTGSTIGEFTSYIVGSGSSDSVRQRMSENKWYQRTERWLAKRGFLTIFALATIPSPGMDVVGFACGSMKYPIYKFGVAILLGKLVKFITTAYIGLWGSSAILDIFG